MLLDYYIDHTLNADIILLTIDIITIIEIGLIAWLIGLANQ